MKIMRVFVRGVVAAAVLTSAGVSYADDGRDDIIPVVWVDIPDANAGFPAANCPDGVGFTGEMARYPTTNAQYARYLNEALASDDIEIDGNHVKGKTGDHAGDTYYRLGAPGLTLFGSRNGGASRIRFSDGSFVVESGFENHPASYVTWFGATAFARHYGWRLPTESEWESVANFNDGRMHATGSSLTAEGPDNAPENGLAREFRNRWYLANYGDFPAEHGLTPVGHFGYYGYGLADMTGNVWEWTDSLWSETTRYRVIRGGSWHNPASRCAIAFRINLYPFEQNAHVGFRVCR